MYLLKAPLVYFVSTTAAILTEAFSSSQIFGNIPKDKADTETDCLKTASPKGEVQKKTSLLQDVVKK
ncbi:unnamed protein product, partial [Timema podura]|nr:unnamed protein product [Timema podura]